MEYFEKDNDNNVEIALKDKFLFQYSNQFSDLIERFLNSTQENLIINFENTEVVDTGALGLLVLGLQKTSDAGKNLSLKNPKDNVMSMLNLMKFNTLFEIERAKV